MSTQNERPFEAYRASLSSVAEALDVSPDRGLSAEEVQARRKEYGPNRIETEETPSWLVFFWDHLTEFVSILLIVVALVALATYLFLEPQPEHLVEALIILFIVAINAVVGAQQEYRSEQTVQEIQEMMKTEAIVIRDGQRQKIDSEELVPGDVVELRSGDQVPADLRLVEVDELATQESVLTGESTAVTKQTDPIDEERPLAERDNLAFMNTHVVRGRGRGIVVATGTETEAGRIAESIKQRGEEEAPFIHEVQAAAKQISYLAIGMVVVASVVFGLYGKDVYEIFLLAAALIVGAIPAALPVTVTYSLTNAMKKMARVNVLVKNLPLLETLGGVDVICTDKTGTLTENRMAVKQFFIPQASSGDPDDDDALVTADELDVERHAELVRCAVWANEAEAATGDEGYLGDPEDVGLLQFVAAKGLDPTEIKDDAHQEDFLPFSSERKMAQALVSADGRRVRYTKGAPEVVLDRCTSIWVDGETPELTDDRKDQIREAVEAFSNQALRNLAFSYRETDDEGVGTETGGEVFLGLVGLWDPPKAGVREAVQTCYDAGIEVKMITGDSKETAVAVAHECGFANIRAVTWAEVKDASEEEMERIVDEHNVFARIDPQMKMALVEALHRLGKRVAITGDGVNDTPPIEAAEVGIAMGERGSDITRDAADLILMDDNFASIVEGIKYGRTSLANVRKVANYLMTANLFEVVVVFLASLMGFTPFRAIQLLWVNFATDIFPAMALGGDPPHPGIMQKKPTGRSESILTRRVWYLLTGIGLKKVLVVFATFFLVLWLASGDTQVLGISGDLILAQSAVFVWLGLSHVVRIVAIRWDEQWRWAEVFINRGVNWSLLWPLVAFIVILYTPLAPFFKVEALPLWTWGVLLATLVIAAALAIAISKGVTRILGEHGETEY